MFQYYVDIVSPPIDSYFLSIYHLFYKFKFTIFIPINIYFHILLPRVILTLCYHSVHEVLLLENICNILFTIILLNHTIIIIRNQVKTLHDGYFNSAYLYFII